MEPINLKSCTWFLIGDPYGRGWMKLGNFIHRCNEAHDEPGTQGVVFSDPMEVFPLDGHSIEVHCFA